MKHELQRSKIKLPRGGCKAIANQVGLKPHTVWMILDGRRNNEKVVAAAKEYLRQYGEKKQANSWM